MKRLLLSMILLFLVGCQQETIIREKGHSGVTGKSNGGDGITIDREMIVEKLNNMKGLLLTLFEGLKDQAKAETLVPGATDLSGHPELVEVLLRMTHFGVGPDRTLVFEDIQTPNNILVQDEPCLDYTGDDHFAATNLEELHGEICFSVDLISAGFPTDSEKSFDIQILALAAHEFLHHFYASGSYEQDEFIANLLQRFVVYQLHKYSEIDEDIITTNSTGYLERFAIESERLLSRSNEAHMLTDEEFEALSRKRGEQ